MAVVQPEAVLWYAPLHPVHQRKLNLERWDGTDRGVQVSLRGKINLNCRLRPQPTPTVLLHREGIERHLDFSFKLLRVLPLPCESEDSLVILLLRGQRTMAWSKGLL